ncbi:uncharacterized protein SPSK_10930 [Sporothrix schenckii 1099-18]|uniref:Uncharacterized protein n=1 Tax=Sporothrix schenckii 1099-18 TaxID=1397361 RepID=A0A0F2M7E4_SPOSC|nr:uncharacterized protein SPSK_10930 [Sporothrix schenckii 1099-18]KJR85557.1 hypothetical protein SPSK_10930 [Sporothrix schenckii 1099-18]
MLRLQNKLTRMSYREERSTRSPHPDPARQNTTPDEKCEILDGCQLRVAGSRFQPFATTSHHLQTGRAASVPEMVTLITKISQLSRFLEPGGVRTV